MEEGVIVTGSTRWATFGHGLAFSADTREAFDTGMRTRYKALIEDYTPSLFVVQPPLWKTSNTRVINRQSHRTSSSDKPSVSVPPHCARSG